MWERCLRSTLPQARAMAGRRPVFLAGGIATSSDTRAALDAGADGIIAGTRFLLTHETNAHAEYQQRLLDADNTIETTPFGLSWPLRHRVVLNAATRKWSRSAGPPERCQLLSTRPAAGYRCWVSRRRCTHPSTVARPAGVYAVGATERHAKFVRGQRSTLRRRHAITHQRNRLDPPGRQGSGALTLISTNTNANPSQLFAPTVWSTAVSSLGCSPISCSVWRVARGRVVGIRRQNPSVTNDVVHQDN